MGDIYRDKKTGLFLPDTARPQAKGYSEGGASLTRRALRGFVPSSGSPNEDINHNNATLRQRARMLYMNSPVATAAINTNRTKVVGIGLSLKSTVNSRVLGLSVENARAWQEQVEAEFALWADEKQNCDAIGMNNFKSLQQLVLKSWLMNGDCFVLITRQKPTPLNPYSLRLHVIEADRVSSPSNFGAIGYKGITDATIPEGEPGAGHKVYDGVEVDESGRVVAYHICSKYPGEWSDVSLKWARVLAYGEKTGLPNVLHIMDSERADQYRGVTYLAQVIEPLLQLRRYTESELMAALVQSFFTAWIETDENPMGNPFNEVGAGDTGGEADNISIDENEYEMAPGTVTHLRRGEKIVFGNPNIPTAGFETFIKTLCKLVGSALEIPYDVLIKEFNSSYSASRGALLEAWEAFRMRRAWLVDGFCAPVYRLWLAEAVARGRIKAPGFFDDPLLRKAWSGAQWNGPVQGQLDPKKEAEAAELQVKNGFKTRTQVTREQSGADWEENVTQLARENEQLAEANGGVLPAPAPSSTQKGDGDED